MQDKVVIIVGAGPSGLAMAGCLMHRSIPYVLLERQDCMASLWKKYAYDRLHLHLRKEFCEMPHFPLPPNSSTYPSKQEFIKYLDDYVTHFNISPLLQRCVEHASYDRESEKWVVKAKKVGSSGDEEEVEEYFARFLVVASGETCDPFVPEVKGLSSFDGEVTHSTMFKNGKPFVDKNVLVVGSGNSGMEIALDLTNHGAKTSVIVRSPVHILSRWMVYLGLKMLKYFQLGLVDSCMALLSKVVYGDMSKYGICRPKEGPFFMKVAYGKYPIIDVGTSTKIKSGEIQVLPSIESIRGNEVHFVNGKSHPFDTIIFCTGFNRSTNKWLKDDDYLLNDDGLPKPSYPNHWKGENGLYCVGLGRRGLYGASFDAQNVANDIKSLLSFP